MFYVARIIHLRDLSTYSNHTSQCSQSISPGRLCTAELDAFVHHDHHAQSKSMISRIPQRGRTTNQQIEINVNVIIQLRLTRARARIQIDEDEDHQKVFSSVDGFMKLHIKQSICKNCC
jgi:hypothetical protein